MVFRVMGVIGHRRPNKGVMGVIGGNGGLFPSLKSTFSLFFKENFPNIFIVGCYRGK